tara:strand:- start:621 stop:773 length:153 start_codon:yes stop_codon:yes gene_type:complete
MMFVPWIVVGTRLGDRLPDNAFKRASPAKNDRQQLKWILSYWFQSDENKR